MLPVLTPPGHEAGGVQLECVSCRLDVLPRLAQQFADRRRCLLRWDPHVRVVLGAVLVPRERDAGGTAEHLAEVPQLDAGHVLHQPEQVGAGGGEGPAEVTLAEAVQLPGKGLVERAEVLLQRFLLISHAPTLEGADLPHPRAHRPPGTPDPRRPRSGSGVVRIVCAPALLPGALALHPREQSSTPSPRSVRPPFAQSIDAWCASKNVVCPALRFGVRATGRRRSSRHATPPPSECAGSALRKGQGRDQISLGPGLGRPDRTSPNGGWCAYAPVPRSGASRRRTRRSERRFRPSRPSLRRT